jgi:hypothetical protein
VLTPRQEFVGVALVADIEQQPIMSEVEHIVHGDGQFDDPEVRREMSSTAGHLIADGVPNLLTELWQLRWRKRLQVGGRLDRLQDAHETFPWLLDWANNRSVSIGS